MKVLVVYASKTGFTKRYAEHLGERIHADVCPVEEVEHKELSTFDDYDAIVYGGWAMAGKISKSEWFIQNIQRWEGKKLILFCVGATPSEAEKEIKEAMEHVATPEVREKARIFYLPGGLNYDKMTWPMKLGMKAFVRMLKMKKNKTAGDLQQIELVQTSYDLSDMRHLEPMIAYLES